MTGVLVNTLMVVAGSVLGLLFKKGIPERVSSAVMIGLGLCTLYIGIDGALECENLLIVIAAMVLGAIVGTLFDIDGAINRLGAWTEKKFQRPGAAEGSVAQGFVTASLLFCVGAMTVNGAIAAGVSGDNSILYAKAMLDLFSSMMLTASLGFGVVLSAAFLFAYEGVLVLLSGVLAPVLTAAAVADMTCAGSLIIIAIATNLIGITKIKVADYMPALVFAPFLDWLFALPFWQQLTSRL